MFRNVWTRAGEFRRSEKNTGVEYWSIGATLKILLDDLKFWIEQNVYSPDEIGTRPHVSCLVSKQFSLLSTISDTGTVNAIFY